MALIDEFDKKLGQIAFKTQAVIKKETPVQTGRLRNSIVVAKENGVWVVGTNLEYAKYVELGVDEHVIRPKNKKALYWQGAPHPVKKVNHPGFDGRNMFLRGSIYAERIIKEEFSK